MRYHVEFFGLPGAGKSMLYKKFFNFDFLDEQFVKFDESIDFSIRQKILNQNINKWKIFIDYFIYRVGSKCFWPVYNYPEDRIKAYFRFIVQQDEFNYKLKKIMRERRFNRSEISEVSKLFFSVCSGFQLAKEYLSENKTLVIDEGFIHRIVALWIRGDNSKQINQLHSYLDIIPLPDLIIYVDVDPDMAIRRQKNRGRNDNLIKSLERLEKEERSKRVKYLKYIINETIKILHDKNVKIIEVKNNDSPDKSTMQLEKMISQHDFNN